MVKQDMFTIGALVVKNPDTWQINDFDSWGRGQGIGEVVSPSLLQEGEEVVNVRWPKGCCFEKASGLKLALDLAKVFQGIRCHDGSNEK